MSRLAVHGVQVLAQVDDPRIAGPRVIDVEQVIFALQRAERRLQAAADKLHDAGDYAAEFDAEEADRMREAVVLLRIATGAPLVSAEEARTVDQVQAQLQLIKG